MNEMTNELNNAKMEAEYRRGQKNGLVKGIAIGATGVTSIIGGIYGIKALVGLFQKNEYEDVFDTTAEEKDVEENEDDDSESGEESSDEGMEHEDE